jgi:hypothetical protein
LHADRELCRLATDESREVVLISDRRLPAQMTVV